MIGAVVVLYNPTNDEIENINTYKNKVDYTVIIDNSDVNNKNLVNRIVNLSESIIYYSKQQNLGLAKAFNIGINVLIENHCEWALLLDADSILENDIIDVYKNAIKYYDNSKDVAIFSPVHMFERSHNKPYLGYRDVDWTMTSGCFYNCDIFKKINGFFEPLFVDGLDMDYCFKSHDNGFKVVECGKAVIKHNPAETKVFLGFKYGIASPTRYYMQARQLLWCWKKYKRINVILIYFYKWFKILFLFPNKKEYINQMVKGTKEGYSIYDIYK